MSEKGCTCLHYEPGLCIAEHCNCPLHCGRPKPKTRVEVLESELDEARAHLQKAEARVKELEAALAAATHDEWPAFLERHAATYARLEDENRTLREALLGIKNWIDEQPLAQVQGLGHIYGLIKAATDGREE